MLDATTVRYHVTFARSNGAVVPYSRKRTPADDAGGRTATGEPDGKGTVLLGYTKGPSQAVVRTWNPACGQVSMPAVCSQSTA